MCYWATGTIRESDNKALTVVPPVSTLMKIHHLYISPTNDRLFPPSLDYGMQLFKADQRGVPKFNPVLGRQVDAEEGIENSVKASLLYTAPEILRTGVSHPDHVGAGTLQGDMYSMAMIMVEIQTHEAAYNEYLDYVDIDDLLQAIAGQKNINSQLPPVHPTLSFSLSYYWIVSHAGLGEEGF